LITNEISKSKISESINESSFTEAALSKLIVVDHTQNPKLEKNENLPLKEILLNVDNSKINHNVFTNEDKGESNK